MALMLFFAGAILGAIVTALIFANHESQNHAKLEAAEYEIIVLNKQIKAQNKIYSEFERRLIGTFRQPESQAQTPPPMLEQQTSPRQTWQIGNTMYFNYADYLEALESGELEKLGGYSV